MTFSNMAGLKKRIFSENIPKLKKKSILSLEKFQISEFHPVFLLIKKGNGNEMKVLAPYHADIFQNGDLKYFEVATIPPTFEL